jgi:hypothetical protein
MDTKWLKSVLKLASLLLVVVYLSSCSNKSVYGSVGVSTGYSSHGFNHHGSGRRMHGSISVGGRIR